METRHLANNYVLGVKTKLFDRQKNQVQAYLPRQTDVSHISLASEISPAPSIPISFT